jgi:proton-translocating NADH-quinone oxidoreductase chain L
MYINIILLPLLNFLIISFLGYYIGRLGCCYISILGLFLSFILSLYIFYEVTINQMPTSIKLYNWLSIDLYTVQVGFLFDSISSIMLIVITFISFIVHLYSITYLSDDPYLSRFMSYLSLFTFFMILLVTSDNFVQIFVGWEGVGLCSYLLINFWYTRLLANKAALKAMIMNRIADVIFLLAIIYIFLKFKTTDFVIVFNLIPFILDDIHFFLFRTFNSLELISFFFLIGAMGKSAQIGFHTWLPDAMEGPTPVSALLHAATMVTAGVFLIVRCSFIIEFSENILSFLIFFGIITTFFAGFVAIFQYDIKKIIAYSTCSQLGYMFIACGLSNYHIAMFHLFNHAFFKALLFLSAGAIIHAFFGEQDMRKFGGNVLLFMPFTYICFIIGSLAIMGFPFLTGFYSKELIIELGLERYVIDSNFCYIVSIFSSIFTIIYSFKLILYSFLIRSINGYKSNYKLFSSIFIESHDNMLKAMIILCIMSIFVGYLFNDIIIGLGTPIWNNSILILPQHDNLLNYHFLPFFIKDLPLIFTLIGIWYVWIFFKITDTNSSFFTIVKKNIYDYHYSYIIYNFFLNYYYNLCNVGYNAFFFNNLYNYIFIKLYKLFYIVNIKYLDKGVFEYFGPFGLYNLNKYILNKCHFFFFHTIYFSLFIKIFSILIILFLIHFFFFNYIGFLFLIAFIFIFDYNNNYC